MGRHPHLGIKRNIGQSIILLKEPSETRFYCVSFHVLQLPPEYLTWLSVLYVVGFFHLRHLHDVEAGKELRSVLGDTGSAGRCWRGINIVIMPYSTSCVAYTDAVGMIPSRGGTLVVGVFKHRVRP